MSTLVCFHAHPDDEVFGTGGVMRAASDAGHRVVLVTATDGALGEVPDGLLEEGESLVQRRQAEVAASAAVLGVHRVVNLGYADSGMAGTEGNSAPGAFATADVEAAAERLAEVLREENATVLTVYDPNGGYGHPDHVQVHHVGTRAGALAEVPFVYEATMNRDHMRMLMEANPAWRDQAESQDDAESAQRPDVEVFGLPESELTTAVDVTAVLDAKRAAMEVHESQIGDFGPFLAMERDVLAVVFGTEWFRRVVPPASALSGSARETALPL
ncbi:PIG-L family deacetylase [Rhodococcoides corynebacterioides]|uniref:PIG-L family deacetylase n=1 Tax=Rhodococcoides corynebacterioides TaxID=53972 RepID=A0ABS7NZI1_9NOCA|nr:PIG-L family deacetylase [Rhodococcus corynebacterioides]MBY6365547.1 PIG-L family deacetylase [Rhodococcus corynebacterioides]MBY6408597.1 PIG-L family deacetylase [Rhodococcus corynebacterioides]